MQLTAMIVNLIYSIIGGVLTLLFMYFGYKWFDKFTKFDTSNELAKDNKAVGLVVMGNFYWYRSCCGSGYRFRP